MMFRLFSFTAAMHPNPAQGFLPTGRYAATTTTTTSWLLRLFDYLTRRTSWGQAPSTRPRFRLLGRGVRVLGRGDRLLDSFIFATTDYSRGVQLFHSIIDQAKSSFNIFLNIFF
jgi:hypothetical protein